VLSASVETFSGTFQMYSRRESGWHGWNSWWDHDEERRNSWHRQDSNWSRDAWGGWHQSHWQQDSQWQEGSSWGKGDGWQSTDWQPRQWGTASSSRDRAHSAPPQKAWEARDDHTNSEGQGDIAAGPPSGYVRRRSLEQRSWQPSEAGVVEVLKRGTQSRVWRPSLDGRQAENDELDKEATLSKLVDIVHTMLVQQSKSFPPRSHRGSFGRSSRRQSWTSHGGCLPTEHAPKVKEIAAAVPEKHSAPRRASTSSEQEFLHCPPSSDSWDWPLSRSETWARVQLIDKRMHLMDRQALEDKLEELKAA